MSLLAHRGSLQPHRALLPIDDKDAGKLRGGGHQPAALTNKQTTLLEGDLSHTICINVGDIESESLKV